MKVLILTGRFGMGHYCAAQAIKEEIMATDKGCDVKIVDVLECFFPIINKFIYSVFNKVICKYAGVYSFMNKLAIKSEKSNAEKYMLAKFDKMIKEYNPDYLISTWSMSSRYASAYKEYYKKSIPLYTFITDITVHDGWVCKNTDLYFVGGTQSKNALIYREVVQEKIIISGIPVRQAFKKSYPKVQNVGKKRVLIMGGGLGLIPSISGILKKLAKNPNIDITVLCGKNTRLKKRLEKSFEDINVVGYTENVSQYMQNADLLISKPGGITIFEAIHSNIPMYIIKPFFSQEIGNAHFIENICIGKIAWEENFDISQDILSLLQNDDLIYSMRNNMQTFKNAISVQGIEKRLV